RMFSFACDALFSFSRVPLRLSMALGLVLLLGGAGLALVVLLRLLSSGSTGTDSTSLILAGLSLVGGLILGSLGVIGAYIARLYGGAGRVSLCLSEAAHDRPELLPPRRLGRAPGRSRPVSPCGRQRLALQLPAALRHPVYPPGRPAAAGLDPVHNPVGRPGRD